MKNLKISAKLLVGFGLVLVMFAISVIVSFVNMSTINKQVSNYSDYTVPNTDSVWQMRRDMVSVQRYILMALTEDDDKLIDEYLNSSSSEAQRLRDTANTYHNTIRVGKEQLSKVEGNFALMNEIRQKIDDLLRENNEESNDAAYVLFEEEYKPILDANADLLIELNDLQLSRGDQQKVDAENAYNAAIILLVAVAAFAVLITIVVVFVITKSILSPVKEIERVSLDIANGNLDTQILYEGKDELGSLASNMRNTTDTLKTIISDVSFLLNGMGDGDFTVLSGCRERYVGQYKDILVALQGIKSNLSDTLTQINQSADQVSDGSDQVSSGAQALSQGATEQASSVQQLSASINEISIQVKDNATNATTASRRASQAGDEIMGSNVQMQTMIIAMNEITEKSNEIGKIIKTIDDIAFQTNILALNAAVEAARAGAAGKGFAVVADEVRNLAGKSAEAAKNTTALIEQTVEAVKNGSTIADETAGRLKETVSVAQEAVTLIDEIARSSGEQATSISQVTLGVEQISAVVQTNSATAEESAAASEELSSQAAILKQLVSKFVIEGSNTITVTPNVVSSYNASTSMSSSDKY